LLYLTPTNEVVSDLDWIKISFEYVLNALKEVEDTATNIDIYVKKYIDDYIDILRRDVMQADEQLRKTCIDLYKKYKDELDIIFEYKKKPFTYTINNVLNEAEANGQIICLPGNDNRNVEFFFTTKEIDGLVKPAKNDVNVWKTHHRIVYRVLITNAENGEPKKIQFMVVYTSIPDPVDLPYRQAVINIAERHNFPNKKKINVGKDLSVIYNAGEVKITVDTITDDFLNEFAGKLKDFIYTSIKQVFEPAMVNELQSELQKLKA
jgi:hypothetical protein